MKLDVREVAEIARSFGDAFYLAKPEVLAANIRSLRDAVRALYPNANLGYSYKTNYLPALIHVAQELGCYSEVVSGAEYELAVRCGIPGDRILFNGPLKRPGEIERAMLAGSVVNLDCAAELDLVGAVCRKYPGRTFGVGIRCHFPLEPGHRSRFGFDIASGAALSAVRRVESMENAEVTGLHCHFTTKTKTPSSYATRIETLADFWAAAIPDRAPRFIDIGGGIFGPMDQNIRSQFAVDVPGYADYAAAIGECMSRRFDPSKTELILEPGVGLVANALDFVTRIVDVRENGGRQIALCTGSVHNVKPSLNKAKLTTHHFPMGGESADFHGEITGYTCLEYDILHEDFHARLAVGDFLKFDSVGAYTIVFTPRFIKPSPPIVMRHQDVWIAIRRAETFDDMFGCYTFDHSR